MPGKTPILAVLGAVVAVALVLVLVVDGGGDSAAAPASAEVPGTPSVELISPRNGAVQRGTAVVVKAEVENFELAPRHFGGEPLLGQGNIRFSLNRVPDCVDPAKLQKAEESALGNGRLVGASFDYPHFAGPNGVLGARIGSTGSYSPATRPEIFYSGLRPGFYRLVVALANNDGSTTPYHDVTNFQILEKPNHEIADCVGGKISSAKAAAAAAED
jgi:hypothetical protein